MRRFSQGYFAESVGIVTLVPGGGSTSPRQKLLDWSLLIGLLLAVPAIYLPYAYHNLPVAGNVDERTSLAVLERFQHGSLNPHFFMYPTLYYYLTYAFIAAVSLPLLTLAKLLFLGRLLNLSFVGLTAFFTYAFCASALRSREVGLLAALCVGGSTIISSSGAYLCTDALLAATTIASLTYLTAYFESGTHWHWLVGIILLGAAVGCKYTAFLLFIAYWLAEMLVSLGALRKEAEPFTKHREQLKPGAIYAFLVTSAVACMGVALFFPTATTLHFVAQNRSNADLRSPLEYLLFFTHLRHLLGAAAVFFGIVAALAIRSKKVYACIALRKIYYGLAIVLFISYLSTPYSLVDPRRFLYDLGALLRNNIAVSSGQPQWINYYHWLIGSESWVLLVVGLAGLVLIAFKAYPHLNLVSIYAFIYLYVIGSSHVGFPRYLTPILPLLYCGVGVTLAELWRHHARWPRWLAASLIVAASAQVMARSMNDEVLSRETDAFFASYQVAKREVRGTVVYAGYAPAVELKGTGLRTRQVSWADLTSGPLALQLKCGDVLIFDKAAAQAHHLGSSGDDVSLLLDDDRGNGQEVMRRSDCK